MTTTTDTSWGPLSHPIRDEVPAEAPPWRDNAFLIFWDPAQELYGTLHVSTSPNAEGRRSRLSLAVGDSVIELVEPLDPGTFTSASMSFDAGAAFAVASERVSGSVHFVPLHALGDFTGDRSPEAFSLSTDEPLMHYQRAATVSGSLTIDGREIELRGHGFRDRTWGYRDESSSVAEYFGYMFVLPGYAITAMRLLSGEGKESTLGFVLAESARPITSLTMTRDASGLFAATTIGVDDGESIEIRSAERKAGFWCPMGWERRGPTLSAFDEFVTLATSSGEAGVGLIEQGVVKRLF